MPLTLHRHAAAWLFALTIAGIVYGSLYPFEFRWAAIPLDAALHELHVDLRGKWSKSNILANVMLFMPFGLFGATTLIAQRAWRRWCLLLAGGALLAFGLQVVQLWLPARYSDFGDGVLNMLGLVLGGVLAQLWARAPAPPALHGDELLALPVLLMGCWVAYKWAPFVPTADWYTIKQNLKPLLFEPRLDLLSVYGNLVCWLVFANLWRDCRLPPAWLWWAIPGVVLAQVGIAHNALALDGVIGAGLALVIWPLLTRLARPHAAVLCLLLALLWLHGLWPYVRGVSPFQWLPFHGFLSGNMFVNLLSLLFKLYLYGALVWLALRTTRSLWAALVIPVIITTLVEIAQTQVAGRVAEITDPLLCALIWSVLCTSRSRMPAHDTGHARQEA
jgi:glycopeptide antibiotics resistance protein